MGSDDDNDSTESQDSEIPDSDSDSDESEEEPEEAATLKLAPVRGGGAKTKTTERRPGFVPRTNIQPVPVAVREPARIPHRKEQQDIERARQKKGRQQEKRKDEDYIASDTDEESEELEDETESVQLGDETESVQEREEPREERRRDETRAVQDGRRRAETSTKPDTITIITPEWFPKEGTIKTAHVVAQLAVLGKTAPTPQQVTEAASQMDLLRATVRQTARSEVQSTVLDRAQRLGVKMDGKVVFRFDQVGKWWAGLKDEEEVKRNAEKMYNIQQVPFEGVQQKRVMETWAKARETIIMEDMKYKYHLPPEKVAKVKCIELSCTRERINQIKNLTKPAKSSHGFYISVRNNDGKIKERKRKKGVWDQSMLKKFVRNPPKNKTNNVSGKSVLPVRTK
jgi:hypothetical protein